MDDTRQMDIEAAKSGIRAYVSQHAGRGDFCDDLNLFDAGLVNSLFVIELMTFIEKSFCVKIEMNDLDMENFESVNAMAALLRKKGI